MRSESKQAPVDRMSVSTPTLIPRSNHFPHLLPPIPHQREPKAPAPRGRSDGRINTHRDLVREMEDLSDEEADLEALVRTLKVIVFVYQLQVYRTTISEDEDSVGLFLSVECLLNRKRRTTCVTLYEIYTFVYFSTGGRGGRGR